MACRRPPTSSRTIADRSTSRTAAASSTRRRTRSTSTRVRRHARSGQRPSGSRPPNGFGEILVLAAAWYAGVRTIAASASSTPRLRDFNPGRFILADDADRADNARRWSTSAMLWLGLSSARSTTSSATSDVPDLPLTCRRRPRPRSRPPPGRVSSRSPHSTSRTSTRRPPVEVRRPCAQIVSTTCVAGHRRAGGDPGQQRPGEQRGRRSDQTLDQFVAAISAAGGRTTSGARSIPSTIRTEASLAATSGLASSSAPTAGWLRRPPGGDSTTPSR